jgi:hypothetical protein
MGAGQSILTFLSFFLVAASPPPPPAAASPPSPAPAVSEPVAANAGEAPEGARRAFRTRKSLAQLEKCLTEKLSKVGEVTSVPVEGIKTLMYRTTDEPPMMIDLAPPSVTLTTKFAIGTEPIVRACL